jgi:hypothetical protein
LSSENESHKAFHNFVIHFQQQLQLTPVMKEPIHIHFTVTNLLSLLALSPIALAAKNLISHKPQARLRAQLSPTSLSQNVSVQMAACLLAQNAVPMVTATVSKAMRASKMAAVHLANYVTAASSAILGKCLVVTSIACLTGQSAAQVFSERL